MGGGGGGGRGAPPPPEPLRYSCSCAEGRSPKCLSKVSLRITVDQQHPLAFLASAAPRLSVQASCSLLIDSCIGRLFVFKQCLDQIEHTGYECRPIAE
jgi:hypothetical protein